MLIHKSRGVNDSWKVAWLLNSTGDPLGVHDTNLKWVSTTVHSTLVLSSYRHAGGVGAGELEITTLCKWRQHKKMARLPRVAHEPENKKLRHRRGELDQSRWFSFFAFPHSPSFLTARHEKKENYEAGGERSRKLQIMEWRGMGMGQQQGSTRLRWADTEVEYEAVQAEADLVMWRAAWTPISSHCSGDSKRTCFLGCLWTLKYRQLSVYKGIKINDSHALHCLIFFLKIIWLLNDHQFTNGSFDLSDVSFNSTFYILY